jgi:hypothetical protein
MTNIFFSKNYILQKLNDIYICILIIFLMRFLWQTMLKKKFPPMILKR